MATTKKNVKAPAKKKAATQPKKAASAKKAQKKKVLSKKKETDGAPRFMLDGSDFTVSPEITDPGSLDENGLITNLMRGFTFSNKPLAAFGCALPEPQDEIFDQEYVDGVSITLTFSDKSPNAPSELFVLNVIQHLNEKAKPQTTTFTYRTYKEGIQGFFEKVAEYTKHLPLNHPAITVGNQS